MAVRQFDGVDDVVAFAPGVVSSLSGALSMMVLAYPLTLASGEFFVAAHIGATGAGGLYDEGSGFIGVGYDITGDATVNIGLTTTTWQIIGFSKASGTATPRLHRAVVGSTGTHLAGSAAIASQAGTVTDFTVGAYTSGGTFAKDCAVAVAAVWTRALADAEFDAMLTKTSDVYSASGGAPAALWEFNQSSLTTAVLDVTGGGADQAARTGTSILDGIDPPWSFDGRGGPPETFDVAYLPHRFAGQG